MNVAEQNRANVRARKLTKYYRNAVLTQAGEPDAQTVTSLLADLSIFAVKNGIDLVQCIHDAAKLATLDEPVERPKAQQPLAAPIGA